MKKTIYASLFALMSVAACATPGIDYEARLMASNPAAAATRTVQVDRFRGPGGGWYAARFEAMLANTTFDGQPWFSLADFSYDNLGQARAGTYTGEIDITSHTFDEYYQTVSKCVEWDGLFDCERREDVEELCVAERVEVQVHPRLIDVDSGTTIFSGTYGGDASYEHCDEAYGHDHGGSRRGLFGIGASPSGDLIRSALSETLRPIRVDIAPRNATVRAKFIAKALDPIVAADPRFELAVKAGRKDPVAACNTWTQMSEQYPEAPAVIHNMGACAEASSDFTVAQSLYARSSQLAVAYSDDGITAPKAFTKALRKLSDQRYGLEIIEDLTRPEPVEPVEEAAS